VRYYRRKANQRAKAVILRILFVVFCAAVITGLAILTGNLLKNKVESANETLDAIRHPSGNSAGRSDTLTQPDTTGDVYSSLVVSASGVIPGNHTSEDSLILRVNTIAESYDTISVTLTDENGVIYTSPALMDVLRMPETQENDAYKTILSICTAAKAKNLRISGVFSSSLQVMKAETAALVDSTLADELYRMGFHEVLFTDVMPEQADTDKINIAREYLETIRSNTDMGLTIGTVLPVSVYLETDYAKQVQMVASVVDFLAIDLTTVTVANNDPSQTLEKVCQALTGIFQIYNMRIVLANPNINQLADQSSLLNRMELTNIQYLGEITPEMLSEAIIANPDVLVDASPVETDANDLLAPQRNPYATTGSSPADTTKEPEETYYRSGEEANSWY